MMNNITKFIYYNSKENYVEINNKMTMMVNMPKRNMEFWAEKLGVEMEIRKL